MKAQKIFAAGAALAALVTATPSLAKAKKTEAQAPTVTEVVVYLKNELELFDAYERQKVDSSKFGCGGAITLKLSRFDIEMTTVTSSDASVGINAEATVPLGPVTVGGSYGRGGSRDFTQTLNLSFDPVPIADLKGKLDVAFFPSNVPIQKPFEHGAVANSLIQLEQSLRGAGAVEPCFALVSDAKQAITMGFSLAKSKKSGFSFSFLIFSVGSNRSESSENINTITAHFVPVKREGGEGDILNNKPPK